MSLKAWKVDGGAGGEPLNFRRTDQTTERFTNRLPMCADADDDITEHENGFNGRKYCDQMQRSSAPSAALLMTQFGRLPKSSPRDVRRRVSASRGTTRVEAISSLRNCTCAIKTQATTTSINKRKTIFAGGAAQSTPELVSFHACLNLKLSLCFATFTSFRLDLVNDGGAKNLLKLNFLVVVVVADADVVLPARPTRGFHE